MRLAPVLVLVLLLAGGCGGLGGTLGEVESMMMEGGERVMRTPMRPIQGPPRVLVIAFDGVGEARLRDALEAGAMPNLQALLGARHSDGLYDHAYQARSVPAVFPAETAAGWAAVFTGTPPAENGVTGNEWFVRDSLDTFAPVPLSVGTIQETLQIWSDSLFSQVISTPTLFEQADVRSHVSLGFVYRGADLMTPPDLNDIGDLLGGAISSVFRGKDQLFAVLDDDTEEGVRRGVEEYGVPDLQIAYFPGVDLATHFAGNFEQRKYLREEIDQHVGDILDLYRDAGMLSDTYVVIVSDHGHSDVLDDDRHSLHEGGRDEPPALVDSLGYRLHDFRIGIDSTDSDVVMIYDEAVAMLHVADRSTCPDEGDLCDWMRPPRLEEDVLPLARAFRDASAAGPSAVGGLSGAIDLIFVRATDPSRQTVPPFQVLDGDRLVPVADYLAANPRPDLVDLERRLDWLTNGPRGVHAGDILILAKSGLHRPAEERFYFGSPRASAHGGASPSESYISLVLAREGARGHDLRDTMQRAVGPAPTQLDVTPLILYLLGRETR